MKKRIVFFIACLLLLLTGCKVSVPAETITISDSTFVLSAEMREVLNAQLEEYRNADPYNRKKVTAPELWSYKFNENCVIAVSQWDDKNDAERELFCTLLYRENGIWQAKQFGEDAVSLTSSSEAHLMSVCESFVQRVGNTTIICLGEADSIVQRFGDIMPEEILDNRGSTKLLMSFAALYENCTTCNWTQAIKYEGEEYSMLSSVIYTDCPYGYIIAVSNLDDAYTLTCGTQIYTGSELENLLHRYNKRT